MTSRTGTLKTILLASLVLGSVLFSLEVAFAQSGDMESAIRIQLSADPSSANLTEAQFEALVAELAQEARAQGITADDIFWRSENSSFTSNSSNATADGCAGVPAVLCVLNESFGFAGGSVLPLLLFLSSAALVLVLWLMRKHHQNLPMQRPIQDVRPPSPQMPPMPPRMPQPPVASPPPRPPVPPPTI